MFIIKGNYENVTNLIIHDHHLIKGSRIIALDKLTSTEILYLQKNIYIDNLFSDNNSTN